MRNDMLNAIWAVMILLAVIYGALTGHMSEVTKGALDSAGEAVSLCITMAGVVALWMGLMEIAAFMACRASTAGPLLSSAPRP